MRKKGFCFKDLRESSQTRSYNIQYPLHISPPVETQETSSPIMAQLQSFKCRSWISHNQLSCPVTALLSFLQASNATLRLFLWVLLFIPCKNLSCELFLNFTFLTGVSLSRSKRLIDFVLLHLVLQLDTEVGNKCQVLPSGIQSLDLALHLLSVNNCTFFLSARLLLFHFPSLPPKKGSLACATNHFLSMSFPRNMD